MRLFLRVLSLGAIIAAVSMGIVLGNWKYAIAAIALSVLLMIVTMRKSQASHIGSDKNSNSANASIIAGSSISTGGLSSGSSQSASGCDAGSSGGADGGC